MRARLLGIGLCITAILCTAAVEAADFDEAYRAGTANISRKQYDEARTALEAALKIAPDDDARKRTYEALIQVYRQIPDSAPMIQAQEYLIANAPYRLARYGQARDLSVFLFQRGLLNKQIEVYEETLKTQPENITALTMLTHAYASDYKKKDRVKELQPVLDKLETANTIKYAEKMETQAAADSRQAAHLWKEAAVSWRNVGDKAKALAAAAKSEQSPPPPSQLLVHFIHRHLGEVYADCDKPQEAIAHLEKAVAATNIDGYKDACKKLLDKLKAPKP